MPAYTSSSPHYPVGATVTYSVATANYSGRTQFSNKLSSSSLFFDYEGALSAAFNTWAAYANIKFREVADGSSVDIRFGFKSIDGTGKTLGITYSQFQGNVMERDDIAFDSAEAWSYKTFQSVALHEIGHALGLQHEDSVPSVMSTYTQGYPTELMAEDIKDIQTLYPGGGGTSTVTPTVTPTTIPTTSTSTIDAGRRLAVTVNGASVDIEMTAYSGPVAWLVNMHIGTASSEAMRGTARADFINAVAGDDAIDGGDGDDVLDGGTGSNFLIGGSGNDTFFVDGRNSGVTWSTVTDLEKGEWVTAWGWQPGVSKLTWEEMAGAQGYKGATAHIDIDGNGGIDMSMTITGKSSGAIITSPGQVNGSNYLAFTLS